MPSPKRKLKRTAAAIQFPGIALFAICLCFASQSSPAQPTKESRKKPVEVVKPREEGIKFQPDKTYDLGSLINLGLGNNPYTQVAWQNARASAAAVGEARAPYYPKAGLHVEGGSDRGYTTAVTGPDYFTRVNIAPAIVLEYLLVDFGRRDADLQRTLHALDAANLSYNRTMQRTVFAIQRSYFAHNAALWQEKAATANLELARTISAMVTERMKSGLATQPEMLLATKTLAQAQFDREEALRKTKTTLGQLRTAVGVSANLPLKITTLMPPSSYQELQGKLDKLIDSALVNRPDLAARIADLRAREAATRRAKADFLPKIRLDGELRNDTFGYRAQTSTASGTYSGNQNQYGAFVVVDWDLFDGFERVERVKRKTAEEQGARAEVEIERLDTILDVWTSYYNTATARRRVDYAESLLLSSQETFNALQASFNEGLATITELAAAQNDLSSARFERANADSEYLTSVAALTLAMGTTPQTAGNPTPK
ncbi:MAG: TolC family protein [Chthoniobacterales bacterium]